MAIKSILNETGGKRIVLILDDRPLIRALLSDALQMGDWEVRSAATPGEALETFKAGSPLMVVINLSMQGLELIPLLEEMKRFNFHGEAVVLSPYSDTRELLSEARDLMFEAQGFGLKYWMVKPFDLDEFRVFIQQAMQELERTSTVEPTT